MKRIFDAILKQTLYRFDLQFIMWLQLASVMSPHFYNCARTCLLKLNGAKQKKFKFTSISISVRYFKLTETLEMKYGRSENKQKIARRSISKFHLQYIQIL